MEKLTITKELIEQVYQLSQDEGHPIMEDGYPFFEWAICIEINENIANYEEENITVDKYIPIQHEDNLVKM